MTTAIAMMVLALCFGSISTSPASAASHNGALQATAIPTTNATAAVSVSLSAARQGMKKLHSYVVYYGDGRLDTLVHYDLAIIQPKTLSTDELVKLKASGTLVVAYLSVGETLPDDPWYKDGRVQKSWLLGQNKDWGSYFVDARQPGWQAIMVSTMRTYLTMGFDGVFLDTVDTAETFPDTAPGMVALITKLRNTTPDAILIENFAFGIAAQVSSNIDALMIENVSTNYDFNTQQYSRIDSSEDVANGQSLAKNSGLPILALDYLAATPGNKAVAQNIVDYARSKGFLASLSTILLDDIPDYGISLTSK
jgi:uncharacterized protein (TIGR01370 family)